jgi:fucose permease
MATPAPVLFLLAYLAFISLGLPDTVLGVAWPSIRDGFGISQAAIGAVLGAGMAGYFLSGLVAGAVMTRIGVGGLLTASSGLVALALVGYSMAPSWLSFFPVGAIMGLGSGAIDAGLNGYAARHFSVRHLNWLHACWGVGASTGPVIMTASIARGLGYRMGYATLALALAAMASAFLLTRRRWDEPVPGPGTLPPEGSPHDANPGFAVALQNGRVWLLIATFFLYTGLETTVGQWCFTLLREGRGLSIEAAGSWTAAYWASLTLGRIALGFVVDRVGPDRLLRLASVGVLCGAISFAASDGPLGRAGLLLIGLSLAPVFPTLMARTPARVGAGTARHAVGFQVSAATLGSALLPALVGILVTSAGLGAISAAALGLALAFFATHELLLRMTPLASYANRGRPA